MDFFNLIPMKHVRRSKAMLRGSRMTQSHLPIDHLPFADAEWKKRFMAIREIRFMAIREIRFMVIPEKRFMAIREKRFMAIREKRFMAIREKRFMVIGEKAIYGNS